MSLATRRLLCSTLRFIYIQFFVSTCYKGAFTLTRAGRRVRVRVTCVRVTVNSSLHVYVFQRRPLLLQVLYECGLAVNCTEAHARKVTNCTLKLVSVWT